MKWFTAVMICTVLTACGVDGEPVRPSLNGGLTIDGNGVHPSASVGVGKGPISLWLGL